MKDSADLSLYIRMNLRQYMFIKHKDVHKASFPSPDKNTYHEIIRWAEGQECGV